MTCPNCGTVNEASSQFCQICGTRLTAQNPNANPYGYQPSQGYQAPQGYQPPQGYQAPQGYQPPQGYQAPQPEAKPGKHLAPPKRPKLPFDISKFLPADPKKLIIPGIAAVVVLAVIIAVTSILAGGSGFPVWKTNYFSVEADGETLIFQDGEQIDDTLDCDINGRSTSLDGQVVALTTEEEELYVLRNGELNSVMEDVYSSFLSDDGSTLAVIDNDQDLYIVDTKSLDSTQVEGDVYWAALSPDGKTVVYTVETEDEEVIMYLYDGKESQELGDNLMAMAVSKGGKYIYCYNVEKESLHVMNSKGDITKLVSSLDTSVPFFMNKDHTQVLFCSEDKWYVSDSGEDEIKVYSKGGYFYMLRPYFAGGNNYYGSFSMQTVPVDDFGGHFYMGGDTLYYMNRDFECKKVSGNIDGDDVQLTADGQTVFYIRESGSLYKATAKKYDEPEELVEDVYGYVITSDGSAVYYVDEDDTLWYQAGSKEPKRIGDDVDYLYMTHDDRCIFQTDYSNRSGELYISYKGSKREELFSDGYDVYPYSTVTYISADYDEGEYSVYSAPKGDQFELIYEP